MSWYNLKDWAQLVRTACGPINERVDQGVLMRSSSTNPVAIGTIAFALLAAFLAPGAAVSQSMPPIPLERTQPDPPTNRFNMPIEGWAIVRYTVLADGTTTDARVVDSMPAVLSERKVRDAVESWTFEPAMNGGKAVDWHHGKSAIVLDADTVPDEPSPMFVRAYREVEAFLEQGNNDEALKSSERLLALGTSRLAEMGVGLVQNARVNLALGNLHEAYAAIRRATDPDLGLLEPSELPVALEYRNRLELGLGDVVGALATFARRKELGEIPEDDLMASKVDAIQSALDSDAAIGVQGKILDETWSHDLARRTFAIGDLDGEIKDVDLECDLGATDLEYSEESEWTVPESWGACTATVSGRHDTEFVFYEFPSASGQ
jgi:TonB family protein